MKKKISPKSKKEIKPPFHVVLLPDGNRRWAQEKNLPTIEGHLAGYQNIKKFCCWCQERGIKVFTAFGFSVENWKRPKKEVKYLMQLLEKGLAEEMGKYHQKNGGMLFSKKVKVRIIGQREKLPLSLQKIIKRVEDLTKNNKDYILNLAISYSGRWDILQAIKRIKKKKVSAKKIDENSFDGYLSTADLLAPDLIIRTGGERRLSNFLLWQAAYSELYFSDKYWPDFTEKDFDKVLREYSHRQRRFGR